MDHPTYEKPTRLLIRPKEELEDVMVSAGITSRSKPDCNINHEIQGEYTGGNINEGKDGRSSKRSYAANAVRKTLERSSEVDRVVKRDITQDVDHVTSDPLQGQSNCQPDEIKVED